MKRVAFATNLQQDTEPGAGALAFAPEIGKAMQSDDMLRVSQWEMEEYASALGRESARRLVEDNLRLRAMLEERREVVDARGKAHKYTRCDEHHLETAQGRVPVPRMADQSSGCEDPRPIDAALNLPTEAFSHCVQRMVAEEAACSSCDQVVDKVCKYSAATTAKRQVEELAVCAARGFDAFHAERADCNAASNDLLVVSTDGKGILMRYLALRKSTKRAVWWRRRCTLDASPNVVVDRTCRHLSELHRAGMLGYGEAIPDGVRRRTSRHESHT